MTAFIVAALFLFANEGDWARNTAKNFSSRSEPVRSRALREFEDDRMAVEEALAEQLRAVFSIEDHSYHGPTHVTLKSIARIRAENVADDLAKRIDFTLDVDTFPPFACPTDSVLHPVAEALVAIGGQKVVSATVAISAEPLSERATRACAWVLTNTVGKEGAKALLEKADKEDRRAGKSTSRRDVLKALEEGGRLLPVIAGKERD